MQNASRMRKQIRRVVLGATLTEFRKEHGYKRSEKFMKERT